jgi:hypothetical protein
MNNDKYELEYKISGIQLKGEVTVTTRNQSEIHELKIEGEPLGKYCKSSPDDDGITFYLRKGKTPQRIGDGNLLAGILFGRLVAINKAKN